MYKIKYENGEVVQCDSCDCRVPTDEFDWGPPFSTERSRPTRALCEFCSTTMASRHTALSSANDVFSALRAEIWKAAAAVFNMSKQLPEENHP